MALPRSEQDAIEALTSWAARRFTRRPVESLTIEAVENLGPKRIELRTVYEIRGVRFVGHRAVPRRLVDRIDIDPWAHRLRGEERATAKVGDEQSMPLGGELSVGCAGCSDQGDLSCGRCGGTGRIQSGQHSRSCSQCSGAGVVVCDMCSGTGSMVASPVVWSLLEEDTLVYTLGGDEMPNEVALGLTDLDGEDAEVEHTQAGVNIAGLERHPESLAQRTGYRDSAQESRLAKAVRHLLEDPPVPAKADMVRQELRILGVPAWRIRTAEADDVWVYGSTPNIYPSSAMRKGGLIGLLARIIGT